MHRTFVDRFQTLLKVMKGDFRHLPKVTIFTIASISIYNLGWGFADPFFSLYLSTFSDQYTIVGLFQMLATVAGVIILIPIGNLLDRMRHSTVVNVAKTGYFVVALMYFIAGITLSIPVLVIALLINGMLGVVVWTGTTSTLRDYSDENDAALTFGFYFAAIKLTWCIGLGIALWLVWKFPIYYIFIPVMIMPLLSMIFTRGIKEKHHQPFHKAIHGVVVKDKFVLRFVQEIKGFNSEMWWMYILRFLGMSIHIVAFVFIPLYAQSLGFSITKIGVLVIIMTIPFLFSFISAEIADHSERLRVIILGLGVSAIAISILSLWHDSSLAIFILSFMFVAGYAIHLPSLSSVISVLTPKQFTGTGSAMATLVQALGVVVFSPIIGFVTDQYGWDTLFIGCGVMLTCVMLIVVVLQIGFKKRNQLYRVNHPRSKHEPYIV